MGKIGESVIVVNIKDNPIDELAKMLYKDLVKAKETPQNALTKVIKAVLPLMRQRNGNDNRR